MTVSGVRASMLLGMGLGLLVLLGLVAATWREEIGLLFEAVFTKDGFKPTPFLAFTLGSVFVATLILFGLLAVSFGAVKDEHKAHQAANRADATPPAVTEDGPDLTARQTTIAYYQARGYRIHDALTGDPYTEVWTKDALEPDGLGVYRRPGVLIYADGSATQFSIAILYNDDVWASGDEVNVKRRQMGKPVQVRTALKRPALREMFDANDYILAIGLASSAPTKEGNQNERLAHARAYNITLALSKLKTKEPARLKAVSFGYATEPPSDPAFEPRQRAVLVVGINASRDVIVDDVAMATTELVQLDGVNLRRYSKPGRQAVRLRTVDPGGEYLRVADMGTTARTVSGPWILPAIRTPPAE